ncbi:hypothetical protein BKA61DRAFT_574811 [Leptodontidium sp. MPI-SDFR-AT-0119]|nr:hypothetical protein BKA61DRAFT_574811 [Leptodontidium sp. MPI-SDFR-AT-0119]
MATFCEVNCASDIVDGEKVSVFACESTVHGQATTTTPCPDPTKRLCGVPVWDLAAPANPLCLRTWTKTTCGANTAQVPCFKDVADITSASIVTDTKGSIATLASATPTSSATDSNKLEPTKSNPPAPSSATAEATHTDTGAPSESSVAANGTASAQSQGTSKSKGLSTGEAAGVGIGGAIAGAVVAGLIFLFLFARYKKRRQQHEQNAFVGHLPNYNSDPGRQEKGISTPTKGGLVITELPQPAEDDAIVGALSRLRDNIKNHAQSFYTTSPVSPQSLNQTVLSEVANDTGIQVSKLQNLLAAPTSRMPALRLCIAWIILSRCDGQGPLNTSLLPEEAAIVAAMIAGIDHKDARKTALASKLKVISGELLQSRPGQAQPLQSAKLEHRIEQAVITINDSLAPFIDSTADANSDKRLRNLESIVRRASQLAILLFSQPSSWALDFGGSGTAQPGTIVVFPGLLEMVSEDGIIREPPRLFNQPEVTAVA